MAFAIHRRCQPSAAVRLVAGISMVSVVFASLAFAADGAWLSQVPAAAHVRVNPLAGRPDSTATGRLLYSEHCASCHGSEAQGIGRRPALVTRRIRSATDGDLAWLLENGNLGKGMPSWSQLPEEQRWQIITYVRSLNTSVWGAWGSGAP